MLKCAIIGLGALGTTHLKNVLMKEDSVKLVALCDVQPGKLAELAEKSFEGRNLDTEYFKDHFYTDAEEMLQKEELDFVITALPTYLHEKYAIMAFEKDLHVFSEKPMARTSQQAQNMIDVSKKTGKKLMIGQVLRFRSSYKVLKDYYDNKKLGELLRADFHRYSTVPVWAWDHWYEDYEKSGCAALDLHIHDVDTINYVFGRPEKVSSIATHDFTKYDSISTRYYYQDGPRVTCSCDWGFSKSYGFRMGYFARFEQGTLEMRENGEVYVCPMNGEQYKVELEPTDHYMLELEDFLDAIVNDREVKIAAPESTKQTLDIIMAEIKSAEIDEPVKL